MPTLEGEVKSVFREAYASLISPNPGQESAPPRGYPLLEAWFGGKNAALRSKKRPSSGIFLAISNIWPGPIRMHEGGPALAVYPIRA